MPSPATCPAADDGPRDRIARQRAVVAEREAALWADGFDAARLPAYQAAFRDLEALIADAGADDRHDFVVVIPVADNPRQTRACLDSLLALCRAYAYGGMADGVYRKLRVLLADDSAETAAIAAHRALAGDFTARGLAVEYFGREQQLALLDGLPDAAELAGIVGTHERARFAHKGQAMMRNIAYLRLAAMPPANQHPANSRQVNSRQVNSRQVNSRQVNSRTLYYTVDGDQSFTVNVATAAGGVEACAVNYLYRLDEIFRESEAWVLTGKVVGDPPVSPAVMAGNFLDDVLAFLREMAPSEPRQAYRQPAVDARASGDAAYHDMADLFGFRPPRDAYRYFCDLPGAPDNAACLLAFSRRLHSFFHGEHPTRVTWYRHAEALASVAPARTVYTGNYVFRREALDWFIPFAPLRLRMSGPTMGRMLRAELGERFVAANLPMLHRRTVADTGASEFRPGVRAEAGRVELCGEFERQFHGDVMLFTLQRLSERGFPRAAPAPAEIAATLDDVRAELTDKYRDRHRAIRAKLAALRALFDDPARWWRDDAELAEARDNFATFAANLEHHFGEDSPCLAAIEAPARRADWRARQLAAIAGYAADRAAWHRALEALGKPE